MKQILLAEDSDRDAELTISALVKHSLVNNIQRVRDGVEALDYLYRRGQFSDRLAGDPAVVLLDLKMPRMDGFEVLEVIRADPELRHLPIVAVFTTANDPDFVRRTYADGANGFLGKPATHEELAAMMRVVVEYWFGATSLPPRGLGPRG